ncbi:hypothetical protein ISF_06814 [Cordyceps fumosorosea ARSEF 2679]|uniref:Uncharacterized protein n=1 Tax=Cordyceps fumosorosea (strain ARSEF 2679) TaxID=1081104 RepID=A0A167R4Z0_CORFA|nr:hypothetical protein ISF_06814 [Cordyceps fumosorosea ARSEF 2679]OAA58275.1 hypothetical protein ISF_06814 [Cordyceps fumosorosea ARSEF 2679]
MLSYAVLFLAAVPAYAFDAADLRAKANVAAVLNKIENGFTLSTTQPPYSLSEKKEGACDDDKLRFNCISVDLKIKDFANAGGKFTSDFKYNTDVDITNDSEEPSKIISKQSKAIKVGTTKGWKIGAKFHAKGGKKDVFEGGGEVTGEYSKTETTETTTTTEITREGICRPQAECAIVTMSFFVEYAGKCTRKPYRYCDAASGDRDWCKTYSWSPCPFERNFHSDNCNGKEYKTIDPCGFTAPVLNDAGGQFTKTLLVSRPLLAKKRGDFDDLIVEFLD